MFPILVISNKIADVEGCTDIRQRDSMIDLVMVNSGSRSVCNVIIDNRFVEVLRYSMSVEILRKETSPGTSGLVFNVQEGGGSWNNSGHSYSDTPKNYDFVTLRYLSFWIP